MADLESFKKEIKTAEGSIPYMYLDTVGKVTVGVGNMLPNAAAAEALPFVNRATNKPATKDEIKTEFDTVHKLTKGMLAGSYKKHTKLDLPETAINQLLNKRIDGFKTQLGNIFPSYNTYPATAQFALLDMIFNLGANGLVSKFPTFTKYVRAEEWENAAKESHRPQVNAARNHAVKTWLEEAAKASKQKSKPQ